MSKPLYQLVDEYRAAVEFISEKDGEISDAASAWLDDLEKDLTKKIGSCYAVLREIETQRDRYAAERDRFAKLERTEDRAAGRLREYILDQMVKADIKRLTTDVGKLTVCEASRPKVEWTGDGEIPEPLRIVKTIVALDRDVALALWESGQAPDGLAVTRTPYLRAT